MIGSGAINVMPWAVLCFCCGALAQEPIPQKAAQSDLEMIVNRADNRPEVHVGDVVRVSCAARNVSKAAVAVPLLEGKDLSGLFEIEASIADIPDPTNEKREQLSVGKGNYRSVILSRDNFHTIAAGESTPLAERSIVPLVPGNAHVLVQFKNSFTHFVDNDGKAKLYPNVWAGSLFKIIEVKVSDKPLVEMVKRYEEAEAFIADTSKPLVDRLHALRKIADERHYFAAEFAIKMYRQASDEMIREAALEHVVSLLDTGTAYAWVDDSIQVLQSDMVPEKLRSRLLKIFAKMNLGSKYPGISVADQAYYALTEKQKTALVHAIKALTTGRNPFLAVEAQKFLAAMDKE